MLRLRNQDDVDMFRRFDKIPACDRQTDRRTDVFRQHNPRYAYVSRGNYGEVNAMSLLQASWCQIAGLFVCLFVGWLVFNGNFSTKRLYCAMRKLEVC